MAVLLNILCTISSMSLALWIYFIKKTKSLADLLIYFHLPVPEKCPWLYNYYLSALIIFIIILLIALVCIIFLRKKDNQGNIDSNQLVNIEPAGEETMLTYLGLFFYALSVPNMMTLLITFALLCIGCYCTQRYSFNPLYILFGYHYYSVHMEKKVVLLISKGKFKPNDTLSFPSLIKLNEYTFLDLDK